MAATTTTSMSSSVEPTPRTLRTLDRLLDRQPAELEGMYRLARTPKLEDVRGDLRGRMLAWPILDSHPVIGEALRTFAASRAFPWRGKSFTPFDGERGEGENRVLSERFRLFRFDTSIGKSKAGAFDAVQLDYDLDGNPGFIRRIEDEIREIEPGVWLGQAYFRTRRGAWLWLYFGLARAGG